MKQALFLILATVSLCACKKQTEFVLQGELNGYSAEEILVIYDDPESKLDTIFPKDGKFTYSFQPDTTTLLRLVSPEGEAIPFVANAGQKVTLKGTFSQPAVTGDGANGELGEFLKATSGMTDPNAVAAEAEKFIRSHPQSFVSAYLINRYFVQTTHPNVEKIDALIAPLQGNIKDCRILSEVLKSLPENKKQITGSQFLNYFSCKDRNGKYVSWSNSKTEYTLVNFWASWDKESITLRDSLTTLARKQPKDRLKVLNISLDYEKDKWLKACKDDSEQWIEVCDFKGWTNQVVKQNNIRRLPAHILIGKGRKILGTNLNLQTLKSRLEEADNEKN